MTMTNQQLMKETAKYLAKSARNYRKTIKVIGENISQGLVNDTDQLGMAQSYRETIRKEARYLHLARTFISGWTYNSVEQSVREGNEVDPVRLSQVCNFWFASLGDMYCTPEIAEAWLNE